MVNRLERWWSFEKCDLFVRYFKILAKGFNFFHIFFFIVFAGSINMLFHVYLEIWLGSSGLNISEYYISERINFNTTPPFRFDARSITMNRYITLQNSNVEIICSVVEACCVSEDIPIEGPVFKTSLFFCRIHKYFPEHFGRLRRTAVYLPKTISV